MLLWFGFLALAAASSGAPPQQICGPTDALDVSLIQLIATPERYEGKKVRLEGFLHYRFEDSALYFSREFADHLIGENSVWIRYAEDKQLCLQPTNDYYNKKKRELRYFDGKWVIIEGTFDSQDHGHLNSAAGAIKDTYRVSESRRYK